MPCIDNILDSESDRVTIYEERIHDGTNAARLCAVLTVLENHDLMNEVLDKADWKEAGTSRLELERWWNNHKKIDLKRKHREEKRAEQAAKRLEKVTKANLLAQRPWASLTPAERRLVKQYSKEY